MRNPTESAPRSHEKAPREEPSPRGRFEVAVSRDETCRSRFVVAVVPAHDEEAAVGEVVRGLLPHCDEVLVVDDGSRDRTADRAREAGAAVLVHPRRQGKGHAIRAGIAWAFAAAEGRRGGVLLVDGDGQHAIGDVIRVLAVAGEGVSLVLGDRSAEYDRMTRARAWTNRCMSWALARALGSGVRDSQCGLRYLDLDLLRLLTLGCGHFDIESEMLAAARAAGAEPILVPISVVQRPGPGHSKIAPVRDGLRFVRLLARLSLSRLLSEARVGARAPTSRKRLRAIRRRLRGIRH